jgi:putative endonuclease
MTVLYTGMTDDINKRAWEHREHTYRGFTHRYNCEFLVWFEMHETRESAVIRERQIKKCNRAWKERLINEMNPDWRDLADTLI